MSGKSKVQLGLFSVVLLGINTIIGTGIFGLPNKAYALVGSMSGLVVIADAILAILLVVCFAEVASWFNSFGGPYLYAKSAFGRCFGYEVGILTFLISCLTWSTVSVFFGDQLSLALTGIGFGPAWGTHFAKTAMTVTLIIVLSVINLLGLKASKTTNNIVTVFKLIPIILLIIFGLALWGASYNAASHAGQSLPMIAPVVHATPFKFVSAIIVFFYSFSGFERLVLAAGDMKNASKNLPIALIIIIATVSVIYIVILFICMRALGPGLALSKSALADTARALMGPNKMLGSIFYATVLTGVTVSVIGINFSFSYITPTTAIALAETGVFPKAFKKVSRLGAPANSILLVFVITVAISLIGHFAYFAAVTVLIRLLVQYLPTVIAVPVLRKRFADRREKGQFRLPGGMIIPIISALVTVALLVFAIKSDFSKMLICIIAMAVVFPFYFLVRDKMKAADEEKAAAEG